MIDYDSFSRCHLTDIFFRFSRGSKRVKFKFCKTSLKLFTLINSKSKEEARQRINHRCLWWQLLFVLKLLSSSCRRKTARYGVLRNKERNDFQAFFLMKSNSGLIAVV